MGRCCLSIALALVAIAVVSCTWFEPETGPPVDQSSCGDAATGVDGGCATADAQGGGG